MSHGHTSNSTDLEMMTDGTIEDCPDLSYGPRGGESGMNAFPSVPKSTLSFFPFMLYGRLRE